MLRLLLDNGGRFDNHVFNGNVLVETAFAGFDTHDFVGHIRAFNDLAEYGITPAIGVGRRVVQEVVVSHVNEKLRGSRMRIVGARHCDGVAVVLQAVVGFVGDGLARGFLIEVLVETAALDHEARNDTMKNGAVVKPVVNVGNKVFNRFGGLLDRKSTRLNSSHV